MARWYGAALTTGSTVEKVQSWPDRIRAVTAEAVHAAAKTWLDKRRSVTGYLVKDAVATGGQALVTGRLRSLIASMARAGRRRRRGRSPRRRPRSSAWSRPAASRPGWCASRRCR